MTEHINIAGSLGVLAGTPIFELQERPEKYTRRRPWKKILFSLPWRPWVWSETCTNDEAVRFNMQVVMIDGKIYGTRRAVDLMIAEFNRQNAPATKKPDLKIVR